VDSQKDIDLIIDDSNANQTKAKLIIDDIDRNIKNINEMNNAVEQRIFNNLYAALIKYFQNAALDSSAVQFELKKVKQNLIVRDAEIMLSRKLNNNEISDVLSQPQLLKTILVNQLQGTAAPNKMINAFNDLEERSNDLTRLEKV
jgi:hypothetical protein